MAGCIKAGKILLQGKPFENIIITIHNYYSYNCNAREIKAWGMSSNTTNLLIAR